MRQILLTLLLVMVIVSAAEADNNLGGEDLHRVGGYTHSRDSSNVSEDHWIDLIDTSRLNSQISVKAEAYTYFGTFRGDQLQGHDFGNAQDMVAEVWPGEIYLETTGGPLLFKLGYQRISWQEGLGLSYTNFINPRDDRASVFDGHELTFRTSPMANLILSLDSISLQVFYLPWSQADIASPFSRWGGLALPFTSPSQRVEVFSTPLNESGGETGARVTWGGRGFDVSFFYSRLRDRQVVYKLSPSSNADLIQLDPEHNFIGPVGLTSSIEIKDYILRAEYLQVPKRQFNSFTGTSLSIYETSEQAVSLILDTPQMSDWSFSFQYSASLLQDQVSGSIRAQNENFCLLSALYQLRHERLIKLISILISDGSFMNQVSYRFPISKELEASIAYENNSGATGSLGSARSDLSRSYVELDHHF